MENYVYELERYEGLDDDARVLGIFSTVEKAREYAEKLISTFRCKYRIDEDWNEDSLGNYEKRLIIEEDKPAYCCDVEDDICFSINKRKMDPEYKED